MRRKPLIWVCVIVLVIASGAGALYAWLVPGLSSARAEPPAAEITVATWLLHQSVPNDAKLAANPLGKDPADITAGRDLFRQKCELCHAYDGSGKSSLGGGQYPHPPALRSPAVASMSDGEIFYHIRNGIRNTAMPAWGLPDRDISIAMVRIRRRVRTRLRFNNIPTTRRAVPETSASRATCRRSSRRSPTRMSGVTRFTLSRRAILKA
jgi:mono/diheme cytochrome c family protein